MVVLKYLFQFGFFPWNSYTTMVRYEGKPFFAPRILGIEKTDNYIKYDLIQLLVLFFHRSLLLVRRNRALEREARIPSRAGRATLDEGHLAKNLRFGGVAGSHSKSCSWGGLDWFLPCTPFLNELSSPELRPLGSRRRPVGQTSAGDRRIARCGQRKGRAGAFGIGQPRGRERGGDGGEDGAGGAEGHPLTVQKEKGKEEATEQIPGPAKGGRYLMAAAEGAEKWEGGTLSLFT